MPFWVIINVFCGTIVYEIAFLRMIAQNNVSEAEYVARCTVVIPSSREQQQPSLSAMESNPNSIKLADKYNTPPPAPTT